LGKEKIVYFNLEKIGAKKVKNGINKEKSGDPFYTLKR
jgi:hypothetical protein